MSRLTDLKLQIDPTDKAVVSFALLQGHIRALMQGSDQVTAFKMDLVLSELYEQYYLIQTEYLQGSSTTKNMLVECNSIIQACKEDREELYAMNVDRLRLVKELKEATDQTLEVMEENQKLKKMVGSLEELNELLNTRYHQMEAQFKMTDQSGQVKQSIQGLNKGYDNLLQGNEELHKDMAELAKQASQLQEFSLPIRVINVAFSSNNSLRELVMRQAEFQLGQNQQLRDLFMGFKFNLGSN